MLIERSPLPVLGALAHGEARTCAGALRGRAYHLRVVSPASQTTFATCGGGTIAGPLGSRLLSVASRVRTRSCTRSDRIIPQAVVHVLQRAPRTIPFASVSANTNSSRCKPPSPRPRSAVSLALKPSLPSTFDKPPRGVPLIGHVDAHAVAVSVRRRVNARCRVFTRSSIGKACPSGARPFADGNSSADISGSRSS